MNKVILIVLVFFSFTLFGQKSAWKRLGRAEKIWVITHPFSVRKAQRITNGVLQELSQLEGELGFHSYNSGSEFDALRHVYWMALLSRDIGHRKALSLGKAHEKKNERDFEQGNLEEGAFVDSVAVQMDLLNNKVGVVLGKQCKQCSNKEIFTKVMTLIKEGKLMMIKQNAKAIFLNQNNEEIPDDVWPKKWVNDRLLVPSNFRL